MSGVYWGLGGCRYSGARRVWWPMGIGALRGCWGLLGSVRVYGWADMSVGTQEPEGV